jgi:site-specific recombinase XerC
MRKIPTSINKCAVQRFIEHKQNTQKISEPLQANYDIRTIQELLGHSDVRTTM